MNEKALREVVRECSGLVTAAGVRCLSPEMVARYQAIALVEARRDPASIEYAPGQRAQAVLCGVHEYLCSPRQYERRKRLDDADSWSVSLLLLAAAAFVAMIAVGLIVRAL
jgi:hypothetical protein